MANLEYMAAGRAHIATFNRAQPEYLTPGQEAFEVEPDDPVALARKMRLLYEDRALCAAMVEKAAARYDSQLALPKFIKRIDNIYNAKT